VWYVHIYTFNAYVRGVRDKSEPVGKSPPPVPFNVSRPRNPSTYRDNIARTTNFWTLNALHAWHQTWFDKYKPRYITKLGQNDDNDDDHLPFNPSTYLFIYVFLAATGKRLCTVRFPEMDGIFIASHKYTRTNFAFLFLRHYRNFRGPSSTTKCPPISKQLFLTASNGQVDI